MYLQMDGERANLSQAIQFGVAFPETCPAAAELAVKLTGYIEARGAWRAWMPVFEAAAEGLERQTGHEEEALLQAERTSATLTSALTSAVLNRLGYFYRYEGQVARAQQAHQTALRMAETGEAVFEEAVAHFGLSELHYYAHQLDEAEVHCQTGLALLAQHGITEIQTCMGLNILGLVAMQRGAYPEAITYFETAIQRWPPGVQPRKLSYCYLNLSTVFRYQKEYSQAQTALLTCIALLAQTTSRLAQSEAEITLGTLLFEMGKWEEARRAYEQIDVHYLEQGGHWSTRAHVANNLGHVCLQEGAYPQAAEHLTYAIQLWRQVGDEVMLANTLGDLAACEMRLGQGALAQRDLAEALTLLARYPDHAWARDRRDELLGLAQEFEGNSRNS